MTLTESSPASTTILKGPSFACAMEGRAAGRERASAATRMNRGLTPASYTSSIRGDVPGERLGRDVAAADDRHDRALPKIHVSQAKRDRCRRRGAARFHDDPRIAEQPADIAGDGLFADHHHFIHELSDVR